MLVHRGTGVLSHSHDTAACHYEHSRKPGMGLGLVDVAQLLGASTVALAVGFGGLWSVTPTLRPPQKKFRLSGILRVTQHRRCYG